MAEYTAYAADTVEVQPKPFVPACVHSKVGESVISSDGALRITVINKHHNYYGGEARYVDTDVRSPKSVSMLPGGSKYYVNSLEGAKTVVYSLNDGKKLKVINYNFKGQTDTLWSRPSGLYKFTHYKPSNTFYGKPVESTFSHGGKYLWVPFYRRSYDINAQDPSALAVIDTRTDRIIRLMETGPLPKMIKTSNSGKYVAVTHWGNNTVGIIDISGDNPKNWKHVSCLVVDYVLPLNFSLTEPVNRDNGSGYALRGTVFTPDDNYLLVGCMGGGGGIAVIDMQTKKYLGRVTGMMANVRHIISANGYLYLSINNTGYVQRIELNKFIEAAKKLNGGTVQLSGWKSCKVGAGARTIEITSDGRYIFAACNYASKLCVVDAVKMTLVASITIDSYPVGLDISASGRYVVVTSQGREGHGGNAVNVLEVEYLNKK